MVRKLAAIALAVVVAGGIFLVVRQRLDAARLPVPPTGQRETAAVREHLQSHYAAARAAPRSIEAVGALCTAYHADMLYDRADACYAVLGELAADDWRRTYYRALIRGDRGGGSDFTADLQRVVEQVPEFGPAWLHLGDAEFKAAHYDRAERAWRRAAELADPSPDGGSPPHRLEAPLRAYAQLGLARIALVRGQVDEARQVLEGVVKVTPQFSPALRLLADSYIALGRTADAARATYRASRLPPFTPYSDPLIDALTRESRNSTLLLRVASEAGLPVNAEWSEYLTRRALQFDPDNPEVVSKLGRILRTVGRPEEAIEFFRRYRQMVPGDYQGLAHLAGCLSDLGRFDEAEPLLRQALTGLDDALTHYNLGLLLALTGRTQEAIAEYETALARDPSDVNARSNLATAFARQGHLDRAATELGIVLARDPDNARAHTNLGVVLAQQGQRARAAAEFSEALRIDPTLEQAAEGLRSLSR